MGLSVKNEKGFSLIEVVIAITIFSFFVTAFLTGIGYNVTDSSLSEEQLKLQLLAERKINELYLSPPKFTNLVTTGFKETKTFEEEDYTGYEYTMEIKKMEMPDFSQLFSQKGAATDEANEANDSDYFNENNKYQRNASVEKMIFDQLKKNVEKVIYQARVTITNKETKYAYSLSTFITNYDEKIQINVAF